MLFERIESKGLAHYSYIIGDGNQAVVIDPRRDCGVYMDMAAEGGYQIKYIMETHRNEDYIIGSVELAARCGAEIWHADAELDYQYGKPSEDGQTWSIGSLELKVICTPGHTPGSMSYLLHDSAGIPWIVFTGDALFAGDIGRVDLPGLDLMDEMAGLLYDSLFNKLLPLGDDVIVCPGHGSGSVCGTAIASRPMTTIGIERKNNPKLRYTDKAEFVEKMAVELERPPYFRMMEKLNLEGAPVLGNLPSPPPLSPDKFAEMAENAIVLDTRTETGFGAAHVPDSKAIWLKGVPSFAGWFLTYDKPILLVNETNNPETVVRMLIRIGFDNIAGYLYNEMHEWFMSGKETQSIKLVEVHDLCHLLDDRKKAWILDVRSEEEIESARITDAHNIHLTQLPERIDEVPKDKPVYVFCGSGLRSMVAASFLQNNGWDNVAVILGGLAGWSSITCPVKIKE
ncbi:MBL fold metallo-hydrolase [Candidatus Poribacteria bacterium]|nr:MBL fold metallo-hydrolase [Candidatus Poribacteria bacterium]